MKGIRFWQVHIHNGLPVAGRSVREFVGKDYYPGPGVQCLCLMGNRMALLPGHPRVNNQQIKNEFAQ